MSAAIRKPKSSNDELSEIAAIFEQLREAAFDGVGVSRLAYSTKESEALGIIEGHARRLGLATRYDPAGNLVASLEGSDPALPFVACGSHIDSVPQGGNFDGAAGVLAALAVLARMKRSGVPPRRSVRLLALRGEESARFGKPYLGSSSLVGKLTRQDLDARAQDDGRTLAECMRGVGIDAESLPDRGPLLDARNSVAWVELHIEQGPVLINRDMPVGIVRGIRGNVRHRAIRCIGEAGHSGAVPRWLRHDAVFAMCELISHLDSRWQALLSQGHDLVMTSGIVTTDPKVNAIARIPEEVRFAFEMRSQSAETLEAAYRLFQDGCRSVSRDRGVTFEFDEKIEARGACMDGGWIERLRHAAADLSIACEVMSSGAGHDAAVFANAGIPSAMVFVRNRNGSHNPREALDLADLMAGIDVMHRAIAEVASR